MGSLPLFISPCHLYEQKEHFTLPGIMNTLTEHSYLTPLSTLPSEGYEQKELFTLPGIMNTLTEHSNLTPLPALQHGVPSLVHLFITPL